MTEETREREVYVPLSVAAKRMGIPYDTARKRAYRHRSLAIKLPVIQEAPSRPYFVLESDLALYASPSDKGKKS